jgi:hypothetical protein
VCSIQASDTFRPDPLLIDTELPLSAAFYPVGFHVIIATNSQDVLDAASECWSHHKPEFACDPIRLRVVVGAEGDLCESTVHRAQGNLYAVVADVNNFANIDIQAFTGMIFVSQKTASDHAWLRWFFLESMVYLLLAQRYLVPVHAACVERNGVGVLLSGRAAAGKSTLTFACARAGWTYVTDDCSWLLPNSDSRTVIGRPWQARFRPDAPALFPELEGHAVRARPTGKLSIEIPLSAFPDIRTASRATIGRLVFLERGPGCSPRLITISGAESVGRLLREMPSYGSQVNAMHERTVRRLGEVPAYRMQYERLDDAIDLLEDLVRTGDRS